MWSAGVEGIVEYEMEIHRVGGRDDLVLKLEIAEGTSFDTIQQALASGFRNHLNIRDGRNRG